MSAAITPGIQPQTVKISTINIDPQPLSITARGGKRIESSTLQILIIQSYKLIHAISLLFLLLLQRDNKYIYSPLQ